MQKIISNDHLNDDHLKTHNAKLFFKIERDVTYHTTFEHPLKSVTVLSKVHLSPKTIRREKCLYSIMNHINNKEGEG